METPRSTHPAASMCFEIWGGRGPGSKNFDFLGKFSKNLDSFRQFRKEKVDFSGQISEKYRFFHVILQKILIFQVKFPKNFDFLGNFPKYFDFLGKFAKNFDFFRQKFAKNIDFPGKNELFIAISWQIMLFLFKSHHFRTYLLYMIRYNNILRPVRDSTTPLRPCSKSGGRNPPTPPPRRPPRPHK